jgi:hypothetical protein
MTYADLLKDPRWQRKRLEVFQRAEWSCELCGDETTTLQVHHLRYVNGHKPWEYPLSDLASLCEPCHAAQPRTRKGLERVGNILPRVLADAAGIARRLGRHSRQWQAILDKFGIADTYNPDVCVTCWSAPRADLTRCAECRALSPLDAA